MKKILFIFLLLLATVSYSQTFYAGPRLGYSSGNMSRPEGLKKGVRSVLAGGAFNFAFNDLFSLQLEAYYLQKGGGYGYRLNKVNYSEYFTFRVVEVPLLARFTVGKSKAKLLFSGGPYLGYILGGKYIYEDDMGYTEEVLNNFTFYDKDEKKTNRLDLGFQVGGGMSLNIGQGKLITELRMGFGLTEWFKLERTTIDNQGFKNLNHRTFTITATYLHPLWSKF